MWNKKFEGWYFKHQKDDHTIAFIPGKAGNHCFVQVVDHKGSRQFNVSHLRVKGDTIEAGNCRFSPIGISIDLPKIKGEIHYGKTTPLKSDIMGPFQYLPMECRHGVLSMSHSLSGELTMEEETVSFDQGLGYIEKDSGTSFPKSYLWLQCNNFSKPCSVMVSVAHIPFLGTSFTGCISSIIYQEREYRFATYEGVRIHSANQNHICLSQGKRLLEIDITPQDKGHPLFSPIKGNMQGIIHESHEAKINCRLWENNKLIFHLQSDKASFEYVPKVTQNKS